MLETTSLILSDEVATAKAAGKPIVALETTIVTHGMPYPENIATALAVEDIVRAAGAVPATIAIMDGKIRVGLTAEELERLAGLKNVMKLSRADLAFALSTGRPGATTVAATMIAADLAGIRVFATGGIGGVHRGAETSFDVSADLHELARTPVAVVCAGAKALLDIPKTLEVLETLGVPVVTYGQDELPAFWSRQSGLPSPLRLDAAGEIAAFIAKRDELGLAGGVLVANPVPAADEIPADEMRAYIEQAIIDAERDKIRAKSVTPYVLGRILELTAGRSLVTNIALVKNNARLAAEIAAALA
ncbi:pseudouridine-5'-phosphate glycosidase [Kaistia dalseonensis]|uniref:Pseudouridine-5'-phosphate glycosidase n=1 Tax=Kaistia dalseonensis TaxID=410840 RepID=A0ABU0HBI5_9HYPH|nr:pseudouridine-5'-phosphate glycosidase [Kaistia dalseonensis]MCX5497041.1 pseudouridine-5'-phosphate glycosidase [Kaistia dalseonensis]MDQ0439667.1 pseudouridine-5'-phosphate glycosidase [Kaistia dalseonensis]